MKWLTKICSIMIACVLLLGSALGIYRSITYCRAYTVPALTEAELQALELSGIRKLMIVAHPDDETLWGGGHLASGGYLVVCLTNGSNPIRAREFRQVMEESGNVGLIRSYPDKVAGKRDDWFKTAEQMCQDLRLLLTWRQWAEIVTHNADGEYGHQHHQLTHTFVTQTYDAAALTSPLYVFGTYYTAKALPDASDSLTALSAAALGKKEELLKLYVSQAVTVKKLSHMAPYEMWEQIRGGTYEAA